MPHEGSGRPVDAARWVDQLARRAHETLPPEIAEYVLQGARHGVTAAEAPGSWDEVRFVPRVLRGVDHVDLSTSLLGTTHRAPLGIAPTTLQRAVHPAGEVAMARAAARAGVPVVVSSNAGSRFADVGATGAAWWVQVYVPQDRSLAEPLLARAVDAGAEAVVLTVDTPVVGTKYAAGERSVWDVVDAAWLRANDGPGRADLPGAAKARDLGPGDVAWLGERTGLPVVVKGVLDPDDALGAVAAGAAAVWVSNHGGRQLDRTVGTVDALPAVARALRSAAPGVPVLVDGGIRGGLDVLAALALGADAVLLGRAPLLALQDGTAGVTQLLDLLVAELEEGHLLAGCGTPQAVRALLTRRAHAPRDRGHAEPI